MRVLGVFDEQFEHEPLCFDALSGVAQPLLVQGGIPEQHFSPSYPFGRNVEQLALEDRVEE